MQVKACASSLACQVKASSVELLQGTLDLIVLRALSTMGPLHAYALATRLAQVSDHPLSLNQGTLYPALVRLEQKGWIKGTWQKTESNREAKYYAITKPGERELTRAGRALAPARRARRQAPARKLSRSHAPSRRSRSAWRPVAASCSR